MYQVIDQIPYVDRAPEPDCRKQSRTIMNDTHRGVYDFTTISTAYLSKHKMMPEANPTEGWSPASSTISRLVRMDLLA